MTCHHRNWYRWGNLLALQRRTGDELDQYEKVIIYKCTPVNINTHTIYTMTQELGNNLLQKVFHYVLPQGLFKRRVWIQLQGSS